MDTKRLSDDLIIGLIFKGDAVLYIKTGKKKNFPDFKMAHDTTDAQKIGQVEKYIHDDLGLAPVSVELLGHIQKNPNDIMQYFINAHIYLYKITVPPDQFITPPPGAAEIGFHDLKAGQQEGFSYKGKLMLDFLKDWTIRDFQRLDAKDIRDWYNKWMGLHLKNAYKEYIDAEIDECHAESECLTGEIAEIAQQGESAEADSPAPGTGKAFKESRQLADLIATTAESNGNGSSAAAPAAAPEGPELQLSALNEIKNHLCGKLYGLKNSDLGDLERRIAYCLMGNWLKRTNQLMDNYGLNGVKLEYDQELKKLVSELESESLSPFEQRRD